MSAGRENRGQLKPDSADDIDLRKGKWTIEEENYANKIIGLFNQGMLPVVAGTTLRTYLSDKLRCDPMRITKKYAGASCIGKQVFQLSESYYECFQENERELQRLENLFLLRINGKGLMGKRAGGGSADVPTPHQSIYETTNFDQAPASNALQLKRVVLPKKKTPMKAASGGNSAKSPSEKARRQQLLQQEYVNAMYGDGLGGGDASYPGNHHHPHSNSYASFLAMNSEGGGGSDDDEGSQGDYGYSYDPDQEDPANPGGQFPYEGSSSSGGLRAGASSVNGALSAGAGAGAGAGTGGVYSSFRAGGRRVLSAPNLTELNLSSWKATDYRPMPAESLKEMFSLPLGSGAGGNNHRGEGEGHSGHSISTLATAAGGGGSSGVCTSLLPEHVYHNLLENGRYSRNSNSANISSNSSSGHHSGVGGDDVGMYQGSSYQNNNHNGSVMAARARATKAALHQHLNLQSPNPYPSHHIKDEGYGGQDNGGFSSFKAKKRSHSAMALVDFEKLAGDDTAAGDLFMQFLDKINNISNRVPGVSSSSSTSNLQQQQVAEQASALVTATSVNSLITSTSTGSLNHGTAVAAGGAALPSIPPSISLSCVPAADADNILPAGPASAAPRIISLSDGAAGSQAMEEV